MNDYQDIIIPAFNTTNWGRYTIEFNINILNVALLTSGVNIIWKNHMAISIVSDPTTASSLRVLCFPQAFKQNISGITGSANLTSLLGTTTNNAALTLLSKNGVWISIRCAYSQNKNVFYLVDDNNIVANPELTIKGELLYANSNSNTNYINYAYRYYWPNNALTTFSIEGAGLNPVSKIYLANVHVFNDYLPQNYLLNSRL